MYKALFRIVTFFYLARPFNQPTTDVPLGVEKYAEYLKSVYKIKPCGEQWLPVVSKHYINLSAIESIEDFPKEKEVTCTLAMIHSKIEDVKKITTGRVSVNMVIEKRSPVNWCSIFVFSSPGWLTRKWKEG